MKGLAKLMASMKFMISLFLCAAVTCEAQTAPAPQVRQNGAVKQFFVDEKPFIMLSGELHNSIDIQHLCGVLPALTGTQDAERHDRRRSGDFGGGADA